jgi:thiol-disulfide isomerase/thioredoxin
MRLLLLSFLSLALTTAVYAAVPPAPAPAAVEAKPAAPPAPAAEKPVLLGAITREQVEAAVPDWVQAEVESAPDPAAVQALAAVPPGAEVVVYMGSWCGDSRREVSRLWRTLDAAGGSLPCTISYIGVDRTKKEPAALVAGSGVRYVPTFIVKRDGREVGRIVESSPHGVEQDLLALLSGSAHGLVTSRPDGAESQPEKQP